MYDNVTSAFLAAMQQQVIQTQISGGIYDNSNNLILAISDDNIIAKSLCISKQLTTGQDLQIGRAFISELNVNVIYDKDDFAKFNGKIIRLTFSVKDANNQWQSVPLGSFDIVEARRSISSVFISAYDYLNRFDKDITLPDSASRTPYQWLDYFCTQCGVTNGMTSSEMDSLPNKRAYSLNNLVGVYNVRQALQYLATISGCFIFMTQDDKVKFKKLAYDYSYALSIPRNLRKDLTIEDNEIGYVVLTMKKADKEYGAVVSGSGKKIELGEMPLLEDFVNEQSEYETACANILSGFSSVVYRPFSLKWHGNPALDLGDWINFSNYYWNGTVEDITTIVTHIDWRYHSLSTVKAVGTVNTSQSPNSSSASQATKEISQVKGKMLKHLSDGSADGSLRGNKSTTESGSYSLGYGATALGVDTKAGGQDGAFACGCKSEASGYSAFSSGYKTKSTGMNANSEGNQTTASGNHSHSQNSLTTASGACSTAIGYNTEASGNNSFSGGSDTKAKEDNQTAIGKYNADNSNALFIVGNGTSAGSRSNAFEVLINGTATSGGKNVARKVFINILPNESASTIAANVAVLKNFNNNCDIMWAYVGGGVLYIPLTSYSVDTSASPVKYNFFFTFYDTDNSAWNCHKIVFDGTSYTKTLITF